MAWRRFAVFVDAGYLLAAGAWAAVGSHRRSDSRARLPELVEWIKAEAAQECPDRELLRLYWYDAAARREPEPQHREVARQPDTKIRLGSINRFGQQKGVDALLLADMMDLASSGTVDTVVLVSGDEDLLEAVKRVQAKGLRLLLWGVDTPKNTLSVELRYESDRCRLLRGAELKPFFERLPAEDDVGPDDASSPDQATALSAGSSFAEGRVRSLPPPPPVRPKWMEVPLPEASYAGAVTVNGDRPVTYADVDPAEAADAARSFVAELVQSGPDLAAVCVDRPQIPPNVDSRLLKFVIRALDVPPDDQLDFDARMAMRNAFWAEIDRRTARQ